MDDIDVAATLASRRMVFRSPWKIRFGDHALPVIVAAGAVVLAWTAVNASGGVSRTGLAVSLLLLLVSATVAWSSRSSYRLLSIEVPGDRDHVRSLALESVAVLGWTVVRDDETLLVCRTGTTAFSWGEYVTLILEEGRLFLNSRAASHGLRRGLSFGKHRKNFERFRASLSLAPSPGIGLLPANTHEPYAETGMVLGCAVVLAPIIWGLGAGLLHLIRESTEPPRAPSYVGEPPPTAEGRFGAFIFFALFLSFFVSVVVKLLAGLILRRRTSILSLQHTFVIFGGLSLAGATFIGDDNAGSFLIAAAIALLLAAISRAKDRSFPRIR